MTKEETIESFKCSNKQAKLRLEVEKMRMDNGEIKELEFYIERDEMAIKALEQEPKTGHWITKIKSDLRGDMWPTNPKCSECGGEPYYSNTIYDYKFCPYCGAKMVDPQERSDKE